MRQPGDENPFDVGHDGVEWFRVFRGVGGKRGSDLARFDPGENGITIRMLEVIGNPVDELMPVAPECLPVHLCVFT